MRSPAPRRYPNGTQPYSPLLNSDLILDLYVTPFNSLLTIIHTIYPSVITITITIIVSPKRPQLVFYSTYTHTSASFSTPLFDNLTNTNHSLIDLWKTYMNPTLPESMNLPPNSPQRDPFPKPVRLYNFSPLPQNI